MEVLMTTNASIPQDSPDFSKRYWLFGYPEYEASGGMEDFIASYDTLEMARASVADWRDQRTLDYLHIFDSLALKTACYFTYYDHGWQTPNE